MRKATFVPGLTSPLRNIALVLSVMLCAACGPAVSNGQPAAPVVQRKVRHCIEPLAAGTWCEDFDQVREGELPAAWVGGEGLAVKQARGYKALSPFESRPQYILSIPGWRAQGDFNLDWRITTRRGDEQFNGSMRLPNTDPVEYVLRSGNLEMALKTSWGGGWPGSVRLGESTAEVPDLANTIVLLSLSRRGKVYKLSVNGKQLLVARYDEQDIDGLTLTISNAGRGFAINAVALYPSAAPAGREAVK